MELEMEVFNKVNNKVSYDGIQGAYVSFGTNNIRFSSEAVRKIGMKVGQYVHFVKIGKDWFFTVNDDTTGYRLSKTSNGNGNKCGALRIWCIPFREHFVKDIGRMGQKDIKFYINPPHSTLTLKGSPLYEILTNKTVKELVKKMKKAHIINQIEYDAEIEKIREQLGRAIYAPETDSLDKLIAFLKKKLLILKNIKKREMVTPDSLVKRCVSKLCKRALMVSSDILEKNKINTNIDTLTVKQLSKIRLSELQKLRSIKPLHLRELKETVREAGLEFKK